MKIAIVSPADPGHEIAAYTRALSAALQQRDDTTVDIVPLDIGRQSKAYYLQLAEVLNAPEIDLVHIQFRHDFWGSLAPAKRLPLAADNMYWHLRFLIKKPVVVTAHETASAAELLKSAAYRSPFIRPLVPILSRNVGYCQSLDTAPFTTAWTIVHSAAERRALVDRGARPDYVSIVPAGFDLTLADSVDPVASRSEIGAGEQTVISLFFDDRNTPSPPGLGSALAGVPGSILIVDHVIRCVTTHNAKPSDAQETKHLEIASDPANDLNASNQTAKQVAASDIVVFSAPTAVTDSALQSALTLGRVVVAPDTELFREMRARLDCVELYPARDHDALVTLVTSLAANASRRAILAANARKYAERFPWSRAAQLTRGVYQSAYEVFSRGHHPH